MKLPSYLGLLVAAEETLAAAYRQVAEGHSREPDVYSLCLVLAAQCDGHIEALHPALDRYGGRDDQAGEPERMHAVGLGETRSGPLGLLRDLQDLYTLASFVDCTWTTVRQAAQALRDPGLLAAITDCDAETATQVAWILTRIKQAAPQTLVAAR